MKIDSSQETIDLLERWRNIVKSGIYRLSSGKWTKNHEPKLLRGERREIEERLSEMIRRIERPDKEIRNRPHRQQQSDEYTADWQFTAPSPQNFKRGFMQRTPDDQPGTSRSQPVTQYNQTENTPMEEGGISSNSELAPSILEVPTINWANYVGVKSVQYIKMGQPPKVQALEQNWDLENTVRETEKEFATDLQLLMTETPNDRKLLNTRLFGAPTIQHPEEYSLYKKKLSTRYGLVIYDKKNHCANQPANNRQNPTS